MGMLYTFASYKYIVAFFQIKYIFIDCIVNHFKYLHTYTYTHIHLHIVCVYLCVYIFKI